MVHLKSYHLYIVILVRRSKKILSCYVISISGDIHTNKELEWIKHVVFEAEPIVLKKIWVIPFTIADESLFTFHHRCSTNINECEIRLIQNCFISFICIIIQSFSNQLFLVRFLIFLFFFFVLLFADLVFYKPFF